MIEYIPAHEDCSYCIHIVEVPVMEGPKTLAQVKRDEMWAAIYAPAIASFFDQSDIFERIIPNASE